MEREQLEKTVEQLHAELASARSIDPQTRALLRKLTNDIDRVLEGEGDERTADVAPMSTGLRELMLKFEADHPRLSLAIGKVADALSAMGI
jgi:hypothetical protein